MSRPEHFADSGQNTSRLATRGTEGIVLQREVRSVGYPLPEAI